MTTILVCGGRTYANKAMVGRVLASLTEPGDTIVHGGARGADELAANWAKRSGMKCVCFEAEWKKHGLAAGPIRNQRMLDEAKPDLVAAFPGGRGTVDMVRRAKFAGVDVMAVGRDGVGIGGGPYR